jgi:hypothetical protein
MRDGGRERRDGEVEVRREGEVLDERQREGEERWGGR